MYGNEKRKRGNMEAMMRKRWHGCEETSPRPKQILDSIGTECRFTSAPLFHPAKRASLDCSRIHCENAKGKLESQIPACPLPVRKIPYMLRGPLHSHRARGTYDYERTMAILEESIVVIMELRQWCPNGLTVDEGKSFLVGEVRVTEYGGKWRPPNTYR